MLGREALCVLDPGCGEVRSGCGLARLAVRPELLKHPRLFFRIAATVTAATKRRESRQFRNPSSSEAVRATITSANPFILLRALRGLPAA